MLYTYAGLTLAAAVALPGQEWIDWTSITGDQWAAWVQAVGSIAAIAAAIWISNRQHGKDLARDALNTKIETLRVLQSLRDEIEVIVERFDQSVGNQILGTTDGIDFIVYIAVDPFKIYVANVSKLGLISESGLRRQIIAIYNDFESVTMFLQSSNDERRTYILNLEKFGLAPSELNSNAVSDSKRHWSETGKVVRELIWNVRADAEMTVVALEDAIAALMQEKCIP